MYQTVRVERSITNLYDTSLYKLCFGLESQIKKDRLRACLMYEEGFSQETLESLKLFLQHQKVEYFLCEIASSLCSNQEIPSLDAISSHMVFQIEAFYNTYSEGDGLIFVACGSSLVVELASLSRELFRYADAVRLAWLPCTLEDYLDVSTLQLQSKCSCFTPLKNRDDRLGIHYTLKIDLACLLLDMLVSRDGDRLFVHLASLIIFSAQHALVMKLVLERWKGLIEGDAHSYKSVLEECLLVSSFASAETCEEDLLYTYKRIREKAASLTLDRVHVSEETSFLALYAAEIVLREACALKYIDHESLVCALEMLADLTLPFLNTCTTVMHESLEELREEMRDILLESIDFEHLAPERK